MYKHLTFLGSYISGEKCPPEFYLLNEAVVEKTARFLGSILEALFKKEYETAFLQYSPQHKPSNLLTPYSKNISGIAYA